MGSLVDRPQELVVLVRRRGQVQVPVPVPVPVLVLVAWRVPVRGRKQVQGWRVVVVIR